MLTRTMIELKPIDNDNEETVRIYNLTKESCERLNNYLLDFVETIQILTERKNKLAAGGDFTAVNEVDESIAFVESKISEVTDSMKRIAEWMPALVELKEVQ
ncbi:MAG TPA: hypothetical protein PK200_14740 [Spirochaetota bacterium]|nr:hypothetical protein [Spirochaetota bacterium]HQO03709.1 hypothetical protein [Spirochaetota bacterium]